MIGTEQTSNLAPREALRQYFGFSEFRSGQQEVVNTILDGKDVVVIMPTGSGKSLCYQLPALLLPGATLVVSPLIALMKDQVDALRARDLPAIFINSSIPEQEQRRRIEGIRNGEYKLVYVAPERFRSPRFVAALAETKISLFAVDEAHCVSTWGHDFRPDYLHLKSVLQSLGKPQIAALSATATAFVRKDITEQLALRDPQTFVSGFDRPNLCIQVDHELSEYDKVRKIQRLSENSGSSGIVYAATRKNVELVGTQLKTLGITASSYHAGMTDVRRARTQEEFMTGQSQVIVATNAFGMGIDKPDIRFVVHFNVPGSIESYYQEIGRAGRDGLPSACLLFFNYFDKGIHEFFIENSYPDKEIIRDVYDLLIATNLRRINLSTKEISEQLPVKRDSVVRSALSHLERAGHIKLDGRSVLLLDDGPQELRVNLWELKRRSGMETRKLEDMIRYCYSDDCYRVQILNYFGDRHHLVRCGICGNCTGQKRTRVPVASTTKRKSRTKKKVSATIFRLRALSDDEYLRVRKILACAKRMNGRYGKNLLAATLRGSAAKNVMSFNLNELSTYGILNDMTHDGILMLVEALVTAKCLLVSDGDYPTISITPVGERVMREQETVELCLPSH